MKVGQQIRRLANPQYRWLAARKGGDAEAAATALAAYVAAIDALEAAATAAGDVEGLAAVERERAFIASAR